MIFIFRGSRGDVESGFSGFIPERRAMRVHGGRPVNSNSLAFLVTVLLLFMILSSHQMPPNFLLWLVLGVFLMATTLRMYATCQQLQAQAQAHAAAASGLFSHTELRLHVPPSIALATRGRLQGLRLQLALLDREFDDLDYETLRALDSDNVSTTSMSEEEINALPVHKYKVLDPEIGSLAKQASTSSSAEQKQDSVNGSKKETEDESLTSGYCVFLGPNLISWSAKRQPTPSRSSSEAEYKGVANTVAELTWIRNLLVELHRPISTASLVYCDNIGSVYLSTNPVKHQRTKHIELDIHFVRDKVAIGEVKVLHVPTSLQYADIFTKGLPTSLHNEFRSSLTVCRPTL